MWLFTEGWKFTYQNWVWWHSSRWRLVPSQVPKWTRLFTAKYLQAILSDSTEYVELEVAIANRSRVQARHLCPRMILVQLPCTFVLKILFCFFRSPMFTFVGGSRIFKYYLIPGLSLNRSLKIHMLPEYIRECVWLWTYVLYIPQQNTRDYTLYF